MNMRSLTQTKTTPKPSFTPVTTGLLQRKCACANSASLTRKCTECENKRLTLQRRSKEQDEVSEVPPIVHEVLKPSGQQLDQASRAFMQQGFDHELSRIAIQKKLTIDEPNDKYEQEADRIAEQVMQISDSPIQHQVKAEQEEKEETIQSKFITQQITPLSQRQEQLEEKQQKQPIQKVTESSIQTLQGSGQALPNPVRTFFEERFGYDFSQVRIHNSSLAAETARTLSAQAFTVGRDIIFNAGHYAPETTRGQFLLAHELTHVVQQGKNQTHHLQRQASPNPFVFLRTNYRFDTFQITARDLSDPEIIARLHALSRPQLRKYRDRVADPAVIAYIDRLLMPQPVEQLANTSITLERTQIENLAGQSYWWRRIGERYQVKWGNWEASDRFKDDEERDAVLSGLWQVQPQAGTLQSETIRYVSIPPRGAKPALLYQLTFRPKPPNQTLDEVDISFVTADPKSVTSLADTPPANYKPKTNEPTSFMTVGFAEDIEQYWKLHNEEKKQLYYWIERQGRSFKQLITTKTFEKKNQGTSVRETSFLVEGKKNATGELEDLSIEFLGANRPQQTPPPADYRSKDAADQLLEQAQEQPDPKKQDRLGHLNLEGINPQEALSVKYAIWNYFQAGIRNAEVDAIVPIAGTNKRVFYTLRFRPDNEVDVERVGEEGQDVKFDPNILDIARVNEYESNANEPKQLKSWLKKRYPAMKVDGATVEQLRTNANNTLITQANTPAWFKANYQIPILDQTQAEKRLKTVHDFKKVQLADLKNYTPDELKQIEFSLEPMSLRTLATLRGVQMARQKISIDNIENPQPFTPNPKWAGFTYTRGSQRTILLFDSAFTSSTGLFSGGEGGVRPRTSMTIAHEFGHAVERKITGLRDAFNKFVQKENIQPFTEYVETAPKREFFAEAFSIYQTDPEWMRSNHPKVYWWFETWSKTGKLPK